MVVQSKYFNGSSIVFYSQKNFVGEGTIKKIERKDPEIVWSQYKNMIFLNEKDYEAYVNISPISKQKRKSKTINVYHLKSLNKFKKPIDCNYKITSAGQYISKEEYQTIKMNL